MKLEFCSTGSSDCPLIILYGDDTTVLNSLINSIRLLIDDHMQLFVNENSGIIAKNLIFKFDLGKDSQIVENDKDSYALLLSKDGWEVVLELLGTLTTKGNENTYQWICGKEGYFPSEIGFLVSNKTHANW